MQHTSTGRQIDFLRVDSPGIVAAVRYRRSEICHRRSTILAPESVKNPESQNVARG